MNGAIFFSTKYGSTAQYANWIAESSGLPVFNIKKDRADLSKYDFVVLGGPIIYHKLFNRKWIKRNWPAIKDKQIILFTVSGASAGPKLDGWIAESLPAYMTSKMKHIALLGRQKPEELTWWDRQMLKIGAMRNKDPQAAKEELEGFEYMDKSSIGPIVKLIQQFELMEALS